MTPQAKMEELIAAGATIQIKVPAGLPEMTLAKVEWRDNPTRLKWCAIYPEHQGHVHELAYERIDIIYDEHMAFYNGAGAMVAYVCPIAAGHLPEEGAKASLAAWRHILSRHTNQAQFEEFFKDAL